MDITFSELRSKEVVNINDGRRLGRVCDIVISGENCTVVALIVPNERKLFRGKDDLVIPWKQIKRIGDDCILVSLALKPFDCTPPHHNPKDRPKNFCDYILDD